MWLDSGGTYRHLYANMHTQKKIISTLDESFFEELNKQQGLSFLNARAYEGLLSLLIRGRYILFKANLRGDRSYHVYNIIFVILGNI